MKIRRNNSGNQRPMPALNDDAWMKKNSSLITKKYAKQWIAVYRQSIIASGTNPELVHQNAKMIAGEDPFTMKHVEKGIVIL